MILSCYEFFIYDLPRKGTLHIQTKCWLSAYGNFYETRRDGNHGVAHSPTITSINFLHLLCDPTVICAIIFI